MRTGALARSGERENRTAALAREEPSPEVLHREVPAADGTQSPDGLRRGTVKWFNNAKGYGFIQADNGGPDLFVHRSSIELDGFRSLSEGEKVSYEERQSPKGLVAVNVLPLTG